MLGNFEYCNPTKLYFGEESIEYLNTELPKYGKKKVCKVKFQFFKQCKGNSEEAGSCDDFWLFYVQEYKHLFRICLDLCQRHVIHRQQTDYKLRERETSHNEKKNNYIVMYRNYWWNVIWMW